jgi:uncharacterized protein
MPNGITAIPGTFPLSNWPLTEEISVSTIPANYYLYCMHLSVIETDVLKQFFAGKPVKKAYLFGSYARNTATAESDIDILVELDYSRHTGLGFVQMLLDLEKLLHTKVDLVTTDGLSEYARPFVDQDKILLYERAA